MFCIFILENYFIFGFSICIMLNKSFVTIYFNIYGVGLWGRIYVNVCYILFTHDCCCDIEGVG